VLFNCICNPGGSPEETPPPAIPHGAKDARFREKEPLPFTIACPWPPPRLEDGLPKWLHARSARSSIRWYPCQTQGKQQQSCTENLTPHSVHTPFSDIYLS
jgi:hypothetical protein